MCIEKEVNYKITKPIFVGCLSNLICPLTGLQTIKRRMI